MRFGNKSGWRHSYILGGCWDIGYSRLEPRESPNALWDGETKECGQITKRQETAGPARSKTVRGGIETVGGGGGEVKRAGEGEGEERKGEGVRKGQGAEKTNCRMAALII